jgi:hypothetical protein
MGNFFSNEKCGKCKKNDAKYFKTVKEKINCTCGSAFFAPNIFDKFYFNEDYCKCEAKQKYKKFCNYISSLEIYNFKTTFYPKLNRDEVSMKFSCCKDCFEEYKLDRFVHFS